MSRPAMGLGRSPTGGADVAEFMTPAWADACREAINGWPTPEVKAAKLQDFWDWIDMMRPFITGRLALSVRDMPARTDTLALDLEESKVVRATVMPRAEAEPDAVFVLAGSYADWVAMLDGYDVGKTVMYRRLMLEKGEVLQFFMAAFFWTELLTAIQHVPTEVPQPV